MLLYVVRHGDPIYVTDTLTPKGFLQAEALAPRFAQCGLDRIYCSPMGRAQDTARPTAKALGLTPEIRDWASEDLAYADFTNRLPDNSLCWCFDSVENDYLCAKENRMRQWDDLDCIQRKERAHFAYDRIAKGIDTLLAEHGYRRTDGIYRITAPNEARIALFCHEGVARFLLSHLLQIPLHWIWGSFSVSHASVTVLEFANHPGGMTAPKCLQFSGLEHIYKEETAPFIHQNRIGL